MQRSNNVFDLISVLNGVVILSRIEDLTYGLPTIRTVLHDANSAARIEKGGSACLVKANAMNEVRKTGVVAHRVGEGLYFDPLQNIRLFQVCSFEPGKRRVIVGKPHISMNERSGRNIALFLAN